MTDMSGFFYEIIFLDNAVLVAKEGLDVRVEATDYPEGDEDKARDKAHDWAERELDNYGADDYELTLVNAY